MLYFFIGFCVFSLLLLVIIYSYGYIKHLTFTFYKIDNNYLPDSIIIAPCKSDFSLLENNLMSLTKQNYKGKYKIVFVIEDINDSSYPVISKIMKTTDKAILVVAGKAVTNGQKNHNILAALKEVEEKGIIYEAVAFFDGDHYAPVHWLTTLIQTLSIKNVEISTLRSIAEPQSVTPLGNIIYSMLNNYMYSVNTFSNQAWGGSFAISTKTMKDYQLEKIWSTSLSHDCPVNGLKAKILFNPTCIPVDKSYDFTIRSYLKWIIRQFTNWRLFSRNLWRLSFFGIASNLFLFISFLIFLVLPFYLPETEIYRSIITIYLISSNLIFSLFISFKMRHFYFWTFIYFFMLPIFLIVLFIGFISSMFNSKICWADKKYIIGKNGSVLKIESNT